MNFGTDCNVHCATPHLSLLKAWHEPPLLRQYQLLNWNKKIYMYMGLFNTFQTALFIVFPGNRKLALEMKRVGHNHGIALRWLKIRQYISSQPSDVMRCVREVWVNWASDSLMMAPPYGISATGDFSYLVNRSIKIILNSIIFVDCWLS